MVKIVVKFKIIEGMEDAYLNDLKPCILATRQERAALSIRLSGMGRSAFSPFLSASEIGKPRQNTWNTRTLP